ncbi:hypothetical protein ACYFX5_17825 [Bremerella sp. T1]|uniref:hypothetical protein n=1 Tax=Bremerella sp. TYQ1 TaxID=3119568 RepID=UPI001CCCDD7F|nr:hypothetical protein [Bremerella volcania]UBM34915.1 hypothetical protein LA756_19780 [Bremerella volcania]
MRISLEEDVSGMDARTIAAVLLTATCVVLSGCALWQTTEDIPPSELPKRRQAEDSVSLEMARISLSMDDEIAMIDVWKEIDEQAIPLDKRRELAANGFRVGVIDFHVPAPLRSIMKAEQGELDSVNSDMIRVTGEDKVAINHRRFPRGKRGEYVMVPLRPEVSLLETVDGALRGETYHDAECKLAIKMFPQNDGRVQVMVTPEIHHGEAKQRVEGSQGMLRVETRREVKVLEQVAFSAMVEPGQTVMLSGTTESKGLGKTFFERESGGSSRRQVLMIRVSGSQFDDLFQTHTSVKENLPLNDDSTDGQLPSFFDEVEAASTGD